MKVSRCGAFADFGDPGADMGLYNEFMVVEHGFHGVKFLCFKRAVADVHVSVKLLVCKVCRGGGGGGGGGGGDDDDDEDDNQDHLDSGVDVGKSAAVGPVTAFIVITTYCVLSSCCLYFGPIPCKVMALCGAANLLCGDRAEALSITDALHDKRSVSLYHRTGYCFLSEHLHRSRETLGFLTQNALLKKIPSPERARPLTANLFLTETHPCTHNGCTLQHLGEASRKPPCERLEETGLPVFVLQTYLVA